MVKAFNSGTAHRAPSVGAVSAKETIMCVRKLHNHPINTGIQPSLMWSVDLTYAHVKNQKNLQSYSKVRSREEGTPLPPPTQPPIPTPFGRVHLGFEHKRIFDIFTGEGLWTVDIIDMLSCKL